MKACPLKGRVSQGFIPIATRLFTPLNRMAASESLTKAIADVNVRIDNWNVSCTPSRLLSTSLLRWWRRSRISWLAGGERSCRAEGGLDGPKLKSPSVSLHCLDSPKVVISLPWIALSLVTELVTVARLFGDRIGDDLHMPILPGTMLDSLYRLHPRLGGFLESISLVQTWNGQKVCALAMSGPAAAAEHSSQTTCPPAPAHALPTDGSVQE